MITILSPIIHPGTKHACVGEMSSGRTCLIRYTIVFEMILYATLHRLIGRKWEGKCGFSVFGIRARKTVQFLWQRLALLDLQYNCANIVANKVPISLIKQCLVTIWAGSFKWAHRGYRSPDIVQGERFGQVCVHLLTKPGKSITCKINRIILR